MVESAGFQHGGVAEATFPVRDRSWQQVIWVTSVPWREFGLSSLVGEELEVGGLLWEVLTPETP